jgi:dihydroorotate dehydrogenase (fumarate)
MAQIEVSYMGLTLKSPIILGASNYSADIAQAKKAEKAGIGAIVYKTLFEEQIELETLQLDESMHEYDYRAAEMETIFPRIEHAGPKEHLSNFKRLKNSVSVPVIASLNAIYNTTWTDYARLLADAGADALEINFYRVPVSGEADAKMIESHQARILKEICDEIQIPVSVKLSPFYTNPIQFVETLEKNGAKAFVLFNRFFQPDIDIEKLEFHYPWQLTPPGDYKITLRYLGLLYNKTGATLVANRGIKTPEEAIKMILAGADAVQMVSAFYENGIEYVSKINSKIMEWMDKKGYASINDFKGLLSKEKLKDPTSYTRAQYVDILKNADEILKLYPMR